MPDAAASADPTLRLDGWGFEGVSVEPSPAFLGWITERVGRGEPVRRALPGTPDQPAPRPLPDLGVALSSGPRERLAAARGRGLTDLLRLRSGSVPAVPDAVARPTGGRELEALLRRASQHGVALIPRGGGTSVTGGVNVIPDGRPTVVVDLAGFSGLESIDPGSGLAVVGAGTRGPALEAALAEHGFTLGHFPQSWELSTLGGWIVTRASGQESLGYGSIQELVAGVELVAPAGRLDLPALPASAAGPDLRQLVLGSEGRLGVVTRAALRVTRRPEHTAVSAWLLPAWAPGLAAARKLVRGRVPLTLLRLSDGPESEVAMTLGLERAAWGEPLLAAWRGLRGVGRGACLMLVGAAGDAAEVDDALWAAAATLRRHGGAGLGRGPGRKWLADRFRHPYLRDSLLDRGIATDTLETAAPWSRLEELTGLVRGALEAALDDEGERVAALCHVSHPYPDGASLYFTFFFRCAADPEQTIERWARIKRRATSLLVDHGGTLSHHHGVGSWHAPWLAREVGADGRRLLAAAAETMDPENVLNPYVLLDPEDRLEV